MSAAFKTRVVLTLPLSILSGSIRPADQHVGTGQAVTAPNNRERREHGEKEQDCARGLGKRDGESGSVSYREQLSGGIALA